MVSAETVSRVRGFSLQSHSAVVAGVVGGYDCKLNSHGLRVRSKI